MGLVPHTGSQPTVATHEPPPRPVGPVGSAGTAVPPDEERPELGVPQPLQQLRGEVGAERGRRPATARGARRAATVAAAGRCRAADRRARRQRRSSAPSSGDDQSRLDEGARRWETQVSSGDDVTGEQSLDHRVRYAATVRVPARTSPSCRRDGRRGGRAGGRRCPPPAAVASACWARGPTGAAR